MCFVVVVKLLACNAEKNAILEKIKRQCEQKLCCFDVKNNGYVWAHFCFSILSY